MIVISRPLFLSPDAAVPAGWLPRIGYQNLVRGLLSTSITVSSETTDGPRDAPLRPDTAEFWQAGALPATWLVDLGGTFDVDYVGLVVDAGTAKASVKVETSVDQISWAIFAADVGPTNDAPLMFIDVLRAVKYARITLEARVTGSTPPHLSVVYIGKLLVMERGLQMGFQPPTLNRDTTLRQLMSRGGQFLGQSIKRMGVLTQPSFVHIPQDWYRANFDPFVAAARRYPYFFAWNSQYYPGEVIYGWTGENISPAYSQQDRLDVSWKIRGIGS